MECFKTALKASVRKEVVMKSSPHALLDDFNVPNGVSFDDSFVDEYLNFSNEDGCLVHGDREEEHDTVQEEHCQNSHHFRDFSAKDDFVPVPASELGVPADDLENLEWLSHFVDDSYSDYSSQFPAGALPLNPKIEETWCEPEKAVRTTVSEACFKTPVPAKARSKRTRTGVRVWPLGSPSVTESSSSSTTSSSSSSPPNHWFIHAGKVQPGSMKKPRVKRQKKTPGAEWVQPPRRCSHCGVQKTPQWRAGPVGAKTLCNACGVRFKSGRLFPEYRPACSPTFSSELHSNNHRKVLEMRKKKEMAGRVDPPPVVPSF